MSATSRIRALTALPTAFAVLAATFTLLVASTPSAKAASCSSTYLSYGSRGTCVKLLQTNLGQLSADGVYGSGTRSRVRSFQDDAGLTVDGKVGPKTWRKLQTYGKALGWKAGVTVYMCKASSTRFRYSVWNNSGKNADWVFYVEGGYFEGDAISDDRIAAQGQIAARTHDSTKLVVWIGRYGSDNAQTTTRVRDFSRSTLPACA
ncbi:peptidoglycan-binding domain-containing protein [Streptomyces fulvoviolaceus]|uniref:peptidoglycan-binding domain-containing protein n=1 Tax=Streptomyces fulvoviolaceus TaxID=285535 RepID=UPI0004CAC1A5|nr:peptidoglycan-binding domain-containing protein [Streptomyces fulvoviolaceus]MCT9075152.1 peptidoglycan-binding protein [Streptomyces fulvoviolaceus]